MGFAKIFELPEGDQLLITKENDPDRNVKWAQLWFRFRREKEGVIIPMHLAFDDPLVRDHVFDNLSLEEALEFYKNLPTKKH